MAGNFFLEFTALYETFSTTHFECVWQTLMNKGSDHENFLFYEDNNKHAKLEKIAREINFLKNEMFEYPEKIMKTGEVIVKEVGAGLEQCKEEIGAAFLKLSKLIKKYNFNNIELILNSVKDQ